MSPQEIKEDLTKILGREPTCSKLKDGKFFADFFRHGAPATQFVGDTEGAAMEALHTFLVSQKKPEAEPAV